MAIQSLERGLELLTAIARHPRGVTLKTLSEETDLPPSTAHRLLDTLISSGFVARSATSRRFYLGRQVRELVNLQGPPSESAIAPRAILDAAEASRETVFLCEFSADHAVCAALARSQYPLQLFVRVGQVMPFNAAASARVLLAWRDANEIERILTSRQFDRYTAATAVEPTELRSQLVAIRERGYDVCDDELDAGVWAVSYPVRSAMDEVVASATLAAPQRRMADEDRRDWARRLMLGCSRQLSIDLGWTPPPEG